MFGSRKQQQKLAIWSSRQETLQLWICNFQLQPALSLSCSSKVGASQQDYIFIEMRHMKITESWPAMQTCSQMLCASIPRLQQYLRRKLYLKPGSERQSFSQSPPPWKADNVKTDGSAGLAAAKNPIDHEESFQTESQRKATARRDEPPATNKTHIGKQMCKTDSCSQDSGKSLQQPQSQGLGGSSTTSSQSPFKKQLGFCLSEPSPRRQLTTLHRPVSAASVSYSQKKESMHPRARQAHKVE